MLFFHMMHLCPCVRLLNVCILIKLMHDYRCLVKYIIFVDLRKYYMKQLVDEYFIHMGSNTQLFQKTLISLVAEKGLSYLCIL